MAVKRKTCKKCGVEKSVTRFKAEPYLYKGQRKMYRRHTCMMCRKVQHLVGKHALAENWTTNDSYWKRFREISDGTVTQAALVELISKYERCPYCSVVLKSHNLSLDHMDPLDSGGANTISNVIPCCHSCNLKKGTKDFNTWFAELSKKNQGILMEDEHCQKGWAGI